MGQIRSLVSGARWFTTDTAYEKLVDFDDNWLMKMDADLYHLKKDGTDDEWEDCRQEFINNSRKKSDEVFEALMKDYNLDKE